MHGATLKNIKDFSYCIDFLFLWMGEKSLEYGEADIL
jgi:hypothetical protein